MILYAVLALQGPAFDLPITSAVEMYDRQIVALPMGRQHMRGYLVSNDGKAVFGVREERLEIASKESIPGDSVFYMRRSETKPLLYTSGQRYFGGQSSVPEADWEEARIVCLLRAPTWDELTLAFENEAGTRSGIATVKWNEDKVPAKLELDPGASSVSDAWQDYGSTDFLAMLSAPDRGASKTVFADGSPGFEVKPGFAPLLMCRSANKMIGQIYMESGFANVLRIKPLTGDAKDETVSLPDGQRIERVAWVPLGKLLVYGEAKEDRAAKAGIFLWEGGKDWKRISPCSLEGQSADGRVLLVSDLFLRKSWLVTLK